MVCTLAAPCLLHVIPSAVSHGVLSLPSEKCSIVPSHNLPAYEHAVDAAASGLNTKLGLKPVSNVVAKVLFSFPSGIARNIQRPFSGHLITAESLPLLTTRIKFFQSRHTPPVFTLGNLERKLFMNR